MTIGGTTYLFLATQLLVVFNTLPISNGESVWNQLQDHTKAAHLKVQQKQQQRQSSQDGDIVHDYPNIFTKDVQLEPIVTSSAGTAGTDATTTTARKGDGKMMMMMTIAMRSIAPIPIPSSSPSSLSSGKGGGGMMMMTSTSSPAPSTLGKGGMMKSKSLSPTISPTTSSYPSITSVPSLTPKGMGPPNVTKSPTAPKVTKSPTQPKSTKSPTQPKATKSPTQPKATKSPTQPKSTKSPTVTGKGKGKKGEEPTSSPSATAVPSVTAVPTYGKMGMMSNGDDKGGMSTKGDMGGMGMMSSPSPIHSPTYGMKKDKDGGSMSKSKMTPAPSIPSFLPTAQPFPSIPTAPTQASNRVQLSLYSLQYMFPQTRVPYAFEVEEVGMITRIYLADYFELRYPDIMELATNITSTFFSLQEPFRINYTSTAIFDTTRRRILKKDDDDNDDYGNVSDDEVVDDDGGHGDDDASAEIVIPPVEELDIVLIAAFTGDNLLSYISLIADLPPENIFRNTTNVTFTLDTIDDDAKNTTKADDRSNSNNGSQGRSAAIPASIAAAVTGAVMIAALSIMMTRHHKVKKSKDAGKRTRQHIETRQKRDPNSDEVDDEGHMTVAGDTCVADSTVVSAGGVSLLSSTYGRRRLFTRRILSQSRPYSKDENPSLAVPLSPPNQLESSLAIVPVQRGISDILSEKDNTDSNSCSFRDDDEYDDDNINDDRSLLPFYCTSPDSAYRGALSEDVNERGKDMLLMQQQKRDDMKVPRHYYGQQYEDIPNTMHHDIDQYNCEDDDDDDTLSVDEDVPLRVIDLIRKFTPSKRRKSR